MEDVKEFRTKIEEEAAARVAEFVRVKLREALKSKIGIKLNEEVMKDLEETASKAVEKVVQQVEEAFQVQDLSPLPKVQDFPRVVWPLQGEWIEIKNERIVLQGPFVPGRLMVERQRRNAMGELVWVPVNEGPSLATRTLERGFIGLLKRLGEKVE